MTAVVARLHKMGIHLLCRTVRKLDRLAAPATVRLDDGSLYTPHFNSLFGEGVPIFRTFHVPRWNP